MQNGTYACRFNLLGYRRDKETKEIRIIPEEAEIVKKIFRMYLQGSSLDQIKAYLEENGVRTVRGNLKWDKHGIRSMLTNEKYAGDIYPLFL
ncbi:MAG: recombinase family protein [Clostridia bacterium]